MIYPRHFAKHGKKIKESRMACRIMHESWMNHEWRSMIGQPGERKKNDF